MDKRYYTPVEMMKIATQHAYCADNLLRNHVPGRAEWDNRDSLLSIVSLMYIAFEITLRAYLLHDHRPVKQPMSLSELLELNRDLVFSSQDMQLLKSLSRQFAFRKGVDYNLWEDRQEFEVFCSEVVSLYERLQKMMPLELQEDYLQIG